MCRLLYVRSKKEFEIATYLNSFATISKNSKEYQGHGWGAAYLVQNNWKVYKEINPIWESDFSKYGKTTCLIAHARSAFKDEGIVIENNMPFYDDNLVFVFNGELQGVKIKEKGRIGAEKIFNFIKRFDKDNLQDAIKKGTDIIKKRSNYIRAMNFIIAKKDSAFLFSHYNEDTDYFTMHKKYENDTIFICSEPFIGETSWSIIPNNSLLEIK